jgi:predicted  nucleic acid-binding Zn ribbon protein
MVTMTVDESALALERARPCPKCGRQPTRTYEYHYAAGRRRRAYCSPCRLAYTLNAVGR